LIPEEAESLNRSQNVTGSVGESGRWSQIVTTSDDTVALMRSQIVTASDKTVQIKRNQRFLPWAFTEHGALMAANILKHEKAAEMSVYVVRAFIRLRQIVLEHEVLARRVSDMEVSLRTHGEALVDIYEKLEPLLDPPVEEKPDRKMGFGKG
jgi:ABC-type molybdate transport system ATPase subunit